MIISLSDLIQKYEFFCIFFAHANKVRKANYHTYERI